MCMDLFSSCDFYFSKFSFLVKLTWVLGWFWLIFMILGNFNWNLNSKKMFFLSISKMFYFFVSSKLFVSCFMIFLGCKLWGLIPYIFGLTTQMVMTFLMAMILWMMINIISMESSFISYLGHLVPFGSPKVLVPFLFSIEVLGKFIRPVALALRLSMKMTTGHVFIGLIAMGLQNVFFSNMFFFLILCLMLLGYLCFELMICLIQAFVFSLLLSVWSVE